jgi:hypothetical protein
MLLLPASSFMESISVIIQFKHSSGLARCDMTRKGKYSHSKYAAKHLTKAEIRKVDKIFTKLCYQLCTAKEEGKFKIALLIINLEFSGCRRWSPKIITIKTIVFYLYMLLFKTLIWHIYL